MNRSESSRTWETLQLQILGAASAVAPGGWIGPLALRRLDEPGRLRSALDHLLAHDLLRSVRYPEGRPGCGRTPEELPESIVISDYGRWLVAAFDATGPPPGDDDGTRDQDLPGERS